MAENKEVKITFKAFNQDFNKAMSEMNKETKTLKQEMKLQSEQMKHTATEAEKLEATISGLGKEYDIAEKRTQATAEALERAKSIWGESSEQVAKMEAKLRSNQIAQQQVANKITETTNALSKLKSADADIEIDVKADTTGIDKMKSEMKSLGAEAKQVGKEVGQHLAAGAATATAAFAAIGGGMDETNQQLAMLETQVKNANSGMVDLTRNTKKMTDDELSNYEDTLEEQESLLEDSLDERYDALDDAYDDQLDRLKDSLDDEMDAFEEAADKKIKLIDKEYTERLKLIDEERYNKIKAIEAEIDGLESLSEAEDKVARDKANAEKRVELENKISSAKTKKNRENAVKALAEFDEKMRLDQIREERKAQIETLKTQKDTVNEQYDAKEEALKTEFELKKEQAEEEIKIDRKRLEERQKLELKSFEERKTAHLKNVEEMNKQELESFKKMNEEKVKVAQKPISTTAAQSTLTQASSSTGSNLELSDLQTARTNFSAVGQDVNQVTEAMGNLIQAGYTTEDQITEISESISGAIVSYGETFNAEGLAESITTTTQLGEATGQLTDLLEKSGVDVDDFNAKMQSMSSIQERANYISKLLASEGLTAAFNEYIKSNPEILAAAEAQQRLTDASSELSTALTPLITTVKNVVASAMEWMAENPKLTQSLAILMAVITAIAGAVAALGPVISGAVKVFGFLTKVLPKLRIAFGALSGPIGWIILILTTAVPLIIKHWDSIAEFFSNLFKAIWEGIKSFGKSVADFFKKWGPWILAILAGPVGIIVKLFRDHGDLIKAVIKKAFEAVGNLMAKPIEKAKDRIRGIVEAIKKLFKFKFEWPELKAPHLKVKKGSLNPLKWFKEGFPEIDIEWFANGGIMTRPTAFGTNGNSLMVGGEAGKEAVIPLNERVLGTIGRAIFDAASGYENNTVVHNYERMLEGATLVVREEADVRRIAKELYNIQQADKRGR